jgi:hypothetical protein
LVTRKDKKRFVLGVKRYRVRRGNLTDLGTRVQADETQNSNEQE